MSFIKDGLVFREIELSDLGTLRNWRNDPEMSVGWHDPRSIQTIHNQEAWYWTLNAENQAFKVVGGDPTDIQGLLRFKLDHVNRSAHMGGMDVAQEHRGQGLARRMLQGGTEYVLRDLGMHRATCEAMVRNVAAIHVVEQVGYKSEGFMRDYTWSNGRWHTWQRFSMLEGELK